MEQLILTLAVVLINQAQTPASPDSTGEKVHVGMAKENLIASLGKPTEVDRDHPEAIFMFRRLEVQAEATLPCMVYVEKNVVTRFRHCKADVTEEI